MIYLSPPLYDLFGFGESDSDSRFSSPLTSSPERLRLCASLRARWRFCCSRVWLSSWPRDLATHTSSRCTPFSPCSATQSPASPHPDFAASWSWSRWQRGRRQGRGDARELPSFSLSREQRTEPTPLGLPQTSTTNARRSHCSHSSQETSLGGGGQLMGERTPCALHHTLLAQVGTGIMQELPTSAQIAPCSRVWHGPRIGILWHRVSPN